MSVSMRVLRRVILASVAASLMSASVASAANLCVGEPAGCYHTVQAAVVAAHDGDTIRIAPGTFAGPVTVAKSVKIEGAGAGRTTIRGGGPVLTIGDPQAAKEPTVLISGLTITGGVTHGDGVQAAGGGIDVRPGPHFTLGATLHLSRVLITGNRVEPTKTLPIGPACPTGPCPYAQGDGGGIASFGTTTIERSIIRQNTVAGVASDARGGGISNFLGSLSMTDVLVSGNRVLATAPNGRFAEGGGVFVESGRLDVRHSIVHRNTARLVSSLPSFAGSTLIDLKANSGAIHVGDQIPTTITDTAITANSVSASDPNGEPISFDSGLYVGDSNLTMNDTIIQGNNSTSTSATTADPGPGGSAIELDGGGTIHNTRIVQNSATQRSLNGIAGVSGALAILNFKHDAKLVTVSDSVIAGNTATTTSPTGTAITQGAGIFNDSLLKLSGVQVRDNSGQAHGLTSIAQGGGIFNSDQLPGANPPVQLTLDNTQVVGNTLSGAPGATLQGGGLFTTLPVTLNASHITHNQPDQCYGCTRSSASAPIVTRVPAVSQRRRFNSGSR